MPITLVTSLPKSPPASANEAPTDTDAPDAGRDFASMLFGQLTQSANDAAGKELLLSGENGTEKTTATDKDDEPNDALALLAALGAPTTSRADASLPAGIAPADIAKAAAHTVSGDPTAASKAALAAQQSDTSGAESTVSFEESMTTATVDPASRKPATFAVPDSAPKDGGALMTAQPGESTPSSHSLPSTHTAIATAASGHAVSRSEIDTTFIPSPLRDPQWNNDFAQKIVWLASNQKQAAELTLTPPNMGSIEVSLRIDNDQATATFVSSNADVRESIETALPRLREMLAGVGISLGQANVSAESFRQAPGQGQENPGASPGASDNAILAGVPRDMTDGMRQLTAGGRGLVDLFA
jgi:flagellar hook-length control protein FliK